MKSNSPTAREKVIALDAKVSWRYCQDPQSGQWVAVCDPLKITVRSESLQKLWADVQEAINLLFTDMLVEGDLEHSWSNMAGQPIRLCRSAPTEGWPLTSP